MTNHPVKWGLGGVVQVRKNTIHLLTANYEGDRHVSLVNILNSFGQTLQDMCAEVLRELQDDDSVKSYCASQYFIKSCQYSKKKKKEF